MTDHKFTGDEIIHSLKVCSNDGDCSECKINPHKGNYGYCTSLAIKAALDLINRQKVQIESLQAVHADMTESLRLAAEANKDMQAEIERLTAERDNEHRCYLHICEDLKQAVNRNITAKSEAIKEFAERLKEGHNQCDGEEDVPWLIDKLVKEMTEESK